MRPGILRWTCASVVSILIGLSIPLQQMMGVWVWDWRRVAFTVLWMWALSHVFLVAIYLVESRYAAEETPPFAEYAKGAFFASIACFVFGYGLAGIETGWEPLQAASKVVARNLETGRMDKRLFFGIWWGSYAALYGSLGMLVYARVRRVRLGARMLAAAEVARIEAHTHLLSLRLDSVQGQVDPAFVLRSLDAIDAAYSDDPAGAEQMLDELIAVLRDAIPKVRENLRVRPLIAGATA